MGVGAIVTFAPISGSDSSDEYTRIDLHATHMQTSHAGAGSPQGNGNGWKPEEPRKRDVKYMQCEKTKRQLQLGGMRECRGNSRIRTRTVNSVVLCS